jgi:hypothetical protein
MDSQPLLASLVARESLLRAIREDLGFKEQRAALDCTIAKLAVVGTHDRSACPGVRCSASFSQQRQPKADRNQFARSSSSRTKTYCRRLLPEPGRKAPVKITVG